jgi:hypothetical protein
VSEVATNIEAGDGVIPQTTNEQLETLERKMDAMYRTIVIFFVCQMCFILEMLWLLMKGTTK